MVPSQFTAGDLVVNEVPYSSSDNTQSLLEYSPSGTLKQTIGTSVYGMDSFGSSEMYESNNGEYLIVPGYATSSGTGGNYAIDTVNLYGNVSETQITGAAGTMRAAASADGTNAYFATSTLGPEYVSLNGGTTTATQLTGGGNDRGVTIANLGSGNQLFEDSDSGTGAGGATALYGPGTVGTGLPETGSQTVTALTTSPAGGFTTSGPSNFGFLFTNSTTLYVANSNTTGTAGTASAPGIQKWSLVSGAWQLDYTALDTTLATADQSFVTLASQGGYLYATTSGASLTTPNHLVQIDDTGSTFTFNTVATATTGDDFLSVAAVPNTALIATSMTLSDTGAVASNTLKATVMAQNGSTPTGNVTFSVNGTAVGTSPVTSGVATYDDTSFPTGSTSIVTAVYTPSGVYAPSHGTLTQGSSSITAGNLVALEVGATYSAGLSSISEPATTATATTSASNSFVVGQAVTISGTGTSYDGHTYTITTVTPGSDEFTFTTTTNIGNASGGTATLALDGNATTTSLVELPSGGGSTVQTISLPSANTSPGEALGEGGTFTKEGYLTDAADSHTVEFAGYNAALGATTTGANGIVGVVNPNGSVESSTEIPNADTTIGTSNSVKAVASADGLGFYVATNDYIQYVPFGNTSATPTTTVSNFFTANDGTSGGFQSSQSPNDVALRTAPAASQAPSNSMAMPGPRPKRTACRQRTARSPSARDFQLRGGNRPACSAAGPP